MGIEEFCHLVDTLVHKNTHFKLLQMDIKKELEIKSLNSPNSEICHFICKNDEGFYIVEGKNKSGMPREIFFIPAADFLKVKKEHELIAIFHSHAHGSAAMSTWDTSTSDNICYPLIVFSNTQRKFGFYVPQYCDANVKDIDRLKEILND